MTSAEHISKEQRLIYLKLPAEVRQEYGGDKVGRLFKSMYGTQGASHIRQLDYVNLICEEAKTESDSEWRGCNKIQICLYEIFLLGPRQIGSC